MREGWHPRDPVAVFGNFFDFRAPLEWYLPDQPVLAVSAADAAPLRDGLRGPGAARRAAAAARSRDMRVGGYFVARLNLDRSLKGSDLERATILIDPSATPTA